MTSITTETRRQVRPLHAHRDMALWHLGAGVIHVSVLAACLGAWIVGWWPLGVLLWLPLAWMHHSGLARLHEAVHGMLLPSKLGNELLGVFLGTLALLPLSVYRHVHTLHHAHLGKEKDAELRPYSLTGCPRWLRLCCAWFELLAGWIATPLFYGAWTVRDWSSISAKRKRRLIVEWGVMIGFWGAVLTAVAATNTWKWFIVGHLIPAWITGTAQTIRKFTEHMGLFGDDLLDMTRTIVYSRPVGQSASRSQLHVEHHGTHHRWPGIPFHNLPEATPLVYGDDTDGRIYTSHFTAMWDMLPHLWNPRVGPQWTETTDEVKQRGKVKRASNGPNQRVDGGTRPDGQSGGPAARSKTTESADGHRRTARRSTTSTLT